MCCAAQGPACWDSSLAAHRQPRGWGVGHRGPGAPHANSTLGDSQQALLTNTSPHTKAGASGLARPDGRLVLTPAVRATFLTTLGLCLGHSHLPRGGSCTRGAPPSHPQNDAHTHPAPGLEVGACGAQAGLGHLYPSCPRKNHSPWGACRDRAKRDARHSARVPSGESVSTAGCRRWAQSCGGSSFRSQSSLAAGSSLRGEKAGPRHRNSTRLPTPRGPLGALLLCEHLGRRTHLSRCQGRGRHVPKARESPCLLGPAPGERTGPA